MFEVSPAGVHKISLARRNVNHGMRLKLTVYYLVHVEGLFPQVKGSRRGLHPLHRTTTSTSSYLLACWLHYKAIKFAVL